MLQSGVIVAFAAITNELDVQACFSIFFFKFDALNALANRNISYVRIVNLCAMDFVIRGRKYRVIQKRRPNRIKWLYLRKYIYVFRRK